MSTTDLPTYRLGADIGGTFTDLLLINAGTGETFTAKVPSTPRDPSQGVLHGIAQICERNGLDAKSITHVMHGTTVATNAVLEGKGAKVGLVTTKGYRQVLQIARSFVPGGLGGWVTYTKKPLLAPLELTIEADERLDARGNVVKPLDEKDLAEKLTALGAKGIEALTVSLINAYTDGIHERRIREIAEDLLPGIPVSISSEVIPEMSEYERTETTVVNSYVRRIVSFYMQNLQAELDRTMSNVNFHVLRSDGGLSSVEAACNHPVGLLMSGPAGGVTGAQWIAEKSGFSDLLTFDMGGTSTDVALIQGGIAKTRRETRVGDVTVLAPSIDVRTVGAGGGSIAYVPELTGALRVGPQSAGADPGPAAYGKGGDKPTVTDANVVLGYLPTSSQLGGDMKLDREQAEKAIATVATALGKSSKEAAEGIINIVNENMFGALRLVSIERGFDPRDFSLVGFGGAGPMHANAIGKLLGAWPVIIPPAPGVLCAYGDVTTRLRDEASRTFIRRFHETSDSEILALYEELTQIAGRSLEAEGVSSETCTVILQADVRYRGQATQLTIEFSREEFIKGGLASVQKNFDELHEQLYTFALETEHELVNVRAVVLGPQTQVRAEQLAVGGADASDAVLDKTTVFVDGSDRDALIYNRDKLLTGNRIAGPAIVCQMDSTILILPDHTGEVDKVGNILIRPNA